MARRLMVRISETGHWDRSARNRGEEDAVPGRLGGGGGSEESEADTGGAGQETGVGQPLVLSRLAWEPGHEAGATAVRPTQRMGARDPVASSREEDRLSGSLEEPVEEVGGARGAMAEASVDHTAALGRPRGRAACQRQRLGLPFAYAAAAGGTEQGQGDTEVAVAPREASRRRRRSRCHGGREGRGRAGGQLLRAQPGNRP